MGASKGQTVGCEVVLSVVRNSNNCNNSDCFSIWRRTFFFLCEVKKRQKYSSFSIPLLLFIHTFLPPFLQQTKPKKMGRRFSKRKNAPPRKERDPNEVYAEVKKENEQMEEYYKAQNIMSEEEWPTFWNH